MNVSIPNELVSHLCGTSCDTFIVFFAVLSTVLFLLLEPKELAMNFQFWDITFATAIFSIFSSLS